MSYSISKLEVVGGQWKGHENMAFVNIELKDGRKAKNLPLTYETIRTIISGSGVEISYASRFYLTKEKFEKFVTSDVTPVAPHLRDKTLLHIFGEKPQPKVETTTAEKVRNFVVWTFAILTFVGFFFLERYMRNNLEKSLMAKDIEKATELLKWGPPIVDVLSEGQILELANGIPGREVLRFYAAQQRSFSYNRFTAVRDSKRRSPETRDFLLKCIPYSKFPKTVEVEHCEVFRKYIRRERTPI